MPDAITYTCDPTYRKFTPKHKSTFSKLMDTPRLKQWRTEKRKDNYYRRNFHFSFGTKIQPRYFCFTCRTNQCRDYKNHHIIEINPIVRIPRQTASKTRWNQFYKELKKYTPEQKQIALIVRS